VTFNIYFRTTFATSEIISSELDKICDENTFLEYSYGDIPLNFVTPRNFETDVVSYGTDAPSFTNVKNKILCGPGSILHAHTEIEQIKIKDIYNAVENVILVYKRIINNNL
jgi:acetylornithine deacetylase